MNGYTPELGQMAFGNPWGSFEVSSIGEAAIDRLFREIERVYGNINQRSYQHEDDPKIPGITVRRYYWGDDEKEAELPNLAVDGHPAEVRWYKHHWRGLTTTVEMSAEDWGEWLERGLDRCRQEEKRHDDAR